MTPLTISIITIIAVGQPISAILLAKVLKRRRRSYKPLPSLWPDLDAKELVAIQGRRMAVYRAILNEKQDRTRKALEGAVR